MALSTKHTSLCALYRSGVLNAEQLEEYDDDIQFLLAKLRKLEENDDVSEVMMVGFPCFFMLIRRAC